MSIDEEALIAAVIRIRARAELYNPSAAECFSALESEFAGLTLALTKKACSKATKRTAGQPKPAAAPAAAASSQGGEHAFSASASVSPANSDSIALKHSAADEMPLPRSPFQPRARYVDGVLRRGLREYRLASELPLEASRSVRSPAVEARAKTLFQPAVDEYFADKIDEAELKRRKAAAVAKAESEHALLTKVTEAPAPTPPPPAPPLSPDAALAVLLAGFLDIASSSASSTAAAVAINDRPADEPGPPTSPESSPLATGILDALPTEVLVHVVKIGLRPPKPLGHLNIFFDEGQYAAWVRSSTFGLAELVALSASSRALHEAVEAAGPAIWCQAAGLAPSLQGCNLHIDNVLMPQGKAAFCPWVLSSFAACVEARKGGALLTAAELALEREAAATLSILRRSRPILGGMQRVKTVLEWQGAGIGMWLTHGAVRVTHPVGSPTAGSSCFVLRSTRDTHDCEETGSVADVAIGRPTTRPALGYMQRLCGASSPGEDSGARDINLAAIEEVASQILPPELAGRLESRKLMGVVASAALRPWRLWDEHLRERELGHGHLGQIHLGQMVHALERMTIVHQTDHEWVQSRAGTHARCTGPGASGSAFRVARPLRTPAEFAAPRVPQFMKPLLLGQGHLVFSTEDEADTAMAGLWRHDIVNVLPRIDGIEKHLPDDEETPVRPKRLFLDLEMARSITRTFDKDPWLSRRAPQIDFRKSYEKLCRDVHATQHGLAAAIPVRSGFETCDRALLRRRLAIARANTPEVFDSSGQVIAPGAPGNAPAAASAPVVASAPAAAPAAN